MVDEKDEAYDTQEEGEYHFSDEQVNYETEPAEVAKVDPVKSAGTALAGLSRYRRGIIIGIIGVIAFIGIYRFLMPGYTPQATDFTPSTQSSAQSARQVPTATQVVTQVTQQPMAQAPIAQQPAQVAPAQMVAGQSTPAQPTQMVPAAATQANSAQPKDMNDRVAALEDQNAKLTSLLQSEYAQKISDYAANEATMQAKLQELNSRVASIEVVINQLNQLLQGQKATSNLSSTQASSVVARIGYVVQAIIPGRAWLKSDSGETITVAEGDNLKGYGRITKIDPYDGVVTIDTGSKILTLSYGMGADS